MSDRNSNGQFTTGNKGGPGNPHARRTSQVRAKLLAAVSDDDLDAVAQALIERARAGEQWAVKELLARLIGDSLITEPDAPEDEQPPEKELTEIAMRELSLDELRVLAKFQRRVAELREPPNDRLVTVRGYNHHATLELPEHGREPTIPTGKVR